MSQLAGLNREPDGERKNFEELIPIGTPGCFQKTESEVGWVFWMGGRPPRARYLRRQQILVMCEGVAASGRLLKFPPE